MENPQENNNNEKEIDKQKEIDRILEFYNESISQTATDFVKHLGENLLGWEGVQVNVIYNPKSNHLVIIHGGPTVQAIINIGPDDKDFKKVLFDIARVSNRAWNPVEIPNGHKVIHKKGDRIVNKRGEPAFVIPMKYCEISTYRSVTIKGPDGVSVTVEDKSGQRLESDLIYEARVKLSQLIEWDNREEE